MAYKMKGYTYPGKSPAKHKTQWGAHEHATGGSGSYEKKKGGGVGKQTGIGETDPNIAPGDKAPTEMGQLGTAGIQFAGDLVKIAISQAGQPKHKFANKQQGFTSMTFGKNRRGKGSATELT